MSQATATQEQTQQAPRGRQDPAAWAAGIAVVLSALHSWPLAGNRWWELLGPTNAVVAAGVSLWIGRELLGGRGWETRRYLPHISVLTYVLIAGLSAAVTPDVGRTAVFEAKLCLAMIGGYGLFKYAGSLPTGRHRLHLLAVVAVCVAVAGCLYGRMLNANSAGFFDSTLKYGTYVGMLLPACCGYLLLGRRPWSPAVGVLLLVCGVLSATSLGCLAAIGAGMLTLCLSAKAARSRGTILGACLISGMALYLAWPTAFGKVAAADCRMQEPGGTHCRQRYIEWQAFLNAMGDRVSGTGLGCINTYRSVFYRTLPKLNTLAPFDQNGWLATAAETGVVGLLCFCWSYAVHLALALQASRRQDQEVHRCGTATLAGLVAAGVANLFCSVQYNGLLIVFVMLMALVPSPAGRDESCDRHATVA